MPDCRLHPAPRTRQEAWGDSEGNYVTDEVKQLSQHEAILRGGFMLSWPRITIRAHDHRNRQRSPMFKLIIAPLIAYLTKLRFPVLFSITAVLFILDSLIPDMIPFVDEILLGLGAALLGSWKKGKKPRSARDRCVNQEF